VILKLEHFVKVLLTKCALNGHLVVLEINRKIQLAMPVEISCVINKAKDIRQQSFLIGRRALLSGLLLVINKANDICYITFDHV
jgi:hypothetical protein